MTARAAARFCFAAIAAVAPRSHFPAELPPGPRRPGAQMCAGQTVPPRPGMRQEAASALRLAALRGCAQRRVGGIAPRPSEAAASARPHCPPSSPTVRARRSRGSGAPLVAGPAGHKTFPRTDCVGTGEQRLQGEATAPHAPSVRPSIYAGVGGGWCVCVTDSAAPEARGQSPSHSPPGATPARPGCDSPFSFPEALPGGGDLSGLAAAPPPSWRVGYVTWSIARAGSNPAAAAGSSPCRGSEWGN